ncbi:MAG: response regulator [Pirellulaceae bacterium]
MSIRQLQTMIVDDDPSIVRLLTKVLHDAFQGELTLHSFSDSVQALEWLDHNFCDILISDIEMPAADGMTMLQRAKARNAWTQVIFLTGHSSWDRVTQAIENGASDFLLKPLDRKEIVHIVRQEIARFGRWQMALRGKRIESPEIPIVTIAGETFQETSLAGL